MSNLIKINNQGIIAKEFNGQRVVTLSDIDLVHERPCGTARRNFNENRDRLVEGEDYIVRNSYEAKKRIWNYRPEWSNSYHRARLSHASKIFH